MMNQKEFTGVLTVCGIVFLVFILSLPAIEWATATKKHTVGKIIYKPAYQGTWDNINDQPETDPELYFIVWDQVNADVWLVQVDQDTWYDVPTGHMLSILTLKGNITGWDFGIAPASSEEQLWTWTKLAPN